MLDYRFSFKNINKPYIIWIVYLLDSCFTCKLLLACMQGKNTKGLLLDCQIVSWDIYDLWSFDSTFQTWYFICQLCHTIYSITFLSALLIILYQVITIHFIKTKKLSRLLNDSIFPVEWQPVSIQPAVLTLFRPSLGFSPHSVCILFSELYCSAADQ